MWEIFWQVVVFGLLLFVLAFVAIIFFNEVLLFSYLLVDYNLRAIYKPQEYPQATLSRYIKNFWQELFYILAKFIYLPYKWLDITVNPKSNCDTAVLLVHGYCRNQSDWLWMRKQLKQQECPIFAVNLEPMFVAIEEITRNSLPTKIKQIKEQTKCKHIILIGHSMGGLVSSYYSEYLDLDNTIKAVITIGTPFSGTKIAVAGAGTNARQMCPGSKFLQELHTKIGRNPTKYYQICSKFDNKIFPWQSALYEHNHQDRYYILGFAAHLYMLRTKEVAKQLNVWISGLIK